MRYSSHATQIHDAEPHYPGLLTYLRIMRPHSLTFSSSASVPPEVVRRVAGWARRVAGARCGGRRRGWVASGSGSHRRARACSHGPPPRPSPASRRARRAWPRPGEGKGWG
eukprot:scaffold27805_cov32-Phaeocystis_antarctica.AAC.1